MSSENIIGALNNVSSNKSADTNYSNTAINNALSDAINKSNNETITQLVSSGDMYYGSNEKSSVVISGNTMSMSDYESCKKAMDSSVSSYSVNKIYSDNTNGISAKKIETETVAEPTKVDSDPDQPIKNTDNVILSTEQISEIVPEKTYSFSIDNLYYTNKSIDVDKNNYTDNINNAIISNNSVIATSNDGIIVEDAAKNYNSMPTYRIVSPEYITQETNIDNNSGINIEKIEHKVVGKDIYHNPTVTYGNNTRSIHKYSYNFSLDDVSASQNLIYTVAGFVSAEIDVSSCGWIELETDNSENTEFYIIEEKNETPILPKGVSYINNEKLFYGMMPRFTIADPNNIIVKRNGEETAINNVNDLYLFLSVNNTDIEVNQSSYFQENDYTISYTPDTAASVYFPSTDKIKIKIIKRNIPNTEVKDIGSVKIYKYNNKNNWTLSLFEDEAECAPPSVYVMP